MNSINGPQSRGKKSKWVARALRYKPSWKVLACILIGLVMALALAAMIVLGLATGDWSHIAKIADMGLKFFDYTLEWMKHHFMPADSNPKGLIKI
jgi:hypothetical protein